MRVLTTIGFHRRSRDEVDSAVRRDDVSREASLPEGVETVTIRRAGETMVWLPGPRPSFRGDRLLGDDAGGLRMCPPGWLRYLEPGLVRRAARGASPTPGTPGRMVLVSHGQAPVLRTRGGRAAIERALG